MSIRFAGKTAVVTGASRGIGLAIARRLVDDGAKVVVTARDQAALEAAVAQLGGPDQALGVAGSVDDATHRTVTIQQAIEVFGSVDLLVNNVGINPVFGPLMEADLEVVGRTLDINAMAALAWVIEAHRAWMQHHGGGVVNVSSFAARQTIPGLGSYGLSKVMLAYLTEQLAVELGPGVRVNAVTPAVVKTRFAAQRYEGHEEQLAAAYPLKRLGLPSDIVGAVAFLLSREADWITGHHIQIDGGLSLLGTVGAEENPFA